MSRPSDRSLVLAWAVGLAVCGVAALVTRAATHAGRRGDEAPAVDTVARAAGDAVAPATTAALDADAAPTLVIPAARRVTPSRPAAAPALVGAGGTRWSRPRARDEVVGPGEAALAAALRDTLRRVLEQAVADSAFPGAFAVVGTSRGVLAQLGAGRIDWAADAPAPTAHTIWDLASLTKVVGTTSAVERLVDQGRISLDARVQRYLPEWTGAGKERVTIRHLLTHTAGLPSWRPLYKEATSAESARALVLATPLDTVPGVRYVYSDLGAILLGMVVEHVSHQPLDRFLAREVFRPLGMTETQYRPDAALRPRIAPTEIDPWRQRHLRGEVHDENAFALGGVSGHAGLFSTGHDLARLARMYLNRGTLDGRRVLTSRTIATFTRPQDTTVSRRALGWETPTGGNSAGHLMSARAFGHTGFTGTSIWIDPERDLFVILLTNRVNPTRQNTKIGGVRVALADAVVQTVTAARGTRPAAPASRSTTPSPTPRP